MRIRLSFAMLALVACGGSSNPDPGAPDVPDVFAEDLAPTDSMENDIGTPDPGASEFSQEDAPADLPGDPGQPEDSIDPGTPDIPAADAPTIDASPYAQCADDETCRKALGPSAVCNRNFPGGQCQNCSPDDLGTAKCGLLGKDGLTLTCKETLPPVCLFDCPCPPWLKCLQDVCALRSCSTDADCAPFVCRPLSEGGNQYCLAPAGE